MALSCTPSGLMAAAACFECLTPKEARSVQTYLLAQMALATGSISNATPASLVAAAKCFDCDLPAKLEEAVIVYLLCQLVNK